MKVTAPSVVGAWKIVGLPAQRPGDVQVKLHCRIDLLRAKPALSCFDRRNGKLTVEGENFRIIWSPTLAQSNVIEAHMTSVDSFAGEEQVLMMGIPLFRSTRTGTRLETEPGTPDAAGKADFLRSILEELRTGTFNHQYDGPLVELLDANDLQSLGTVTAITYLDGANAVRDQKVVADFFSLYAVNFQNGRLFCGLHQRDDGVLDGFRCN